MIRAPRLCAKTRSSTLYTS